jgi:hypothetical protein
MGTDTERIATGFRFIHELWGCFIDIVVAMYLLERQLGVACLSPLAIILCMYTVMCFLFDHRELIGVQHLPQ